MIQSNNIQLMKNQKKNAQKVAKELNCGLLHDAKSIAKYIKSNTVKYNLVCTEGHQQKRKEGAGCTK